MEERLTISIDRDSQKWAVFRDDFDLVHPFTPYNKGENVLATASAWCVANGDNTPKVVYPRITSMRVHSTKARAAKSASAA